MIVSKENIKLSWSEKDARHSVTKAFNDKERKEEEEEEVLMNAALFQNPNTVIFLAKMDAKGR